MDRVFIERLVFTGGPTEQVHFLGVVQAAGNEIAVLVELAYLCVG